MRLTKKQLSNIIFEVLGLEGGEASSPRTPRIFVLVGPPSIGKSTWIDNEFAEIDPYVISRDDIVEQVAGDRGWAYDDMFVSPPDDAVIGDVDEKYGEVQAPPQWMTWASSVFSDVLAANGEVQDAFNSRVSGAVPSGADVVVDMTNMTAASRARSLAAIKGSEDLYEKIAIDFKFKGAEEIIMAVAEKRAESAARMGKSKTIPRAAIERIMGTYEPPTTAEGFDSIVDVDNREILADLIDSD